LPFEKDTFSCLLPETASNLLRVAEALAGAAAGASTEQNRAKPSGTEQNRAELSKTERNRAKPSIPGFAPRKTEQNRVAR
jgi:hypothetical protein